MHQRRPLCWLDSLPAHPAFFSFFFPFHPAASLLCSSSTAAGAGMYSIQGNQLFIYLGGQVAGPFDLSGLLALVNGGSGGGGGRRLLNSSSGLSISSLAFDGSSLWVVLSNG